MECSTGLQIDSRQAARVELARQGFWVEIGPAGQYSDATPETESTLLEELRHEPWRQVVARHFAEKKPWLHRIITHPTRSLFLDVLPLEPKGRFLDVGSGWGQVAIPLSRLGSVFCLDLTIRRLEILQEIARQEDAPLQYVCGNFQSFPFEEQQFDLVVFNGTLEWIALGSSEATIWDVQAAALHKSARILKPGGIVYIGIENALGLKYLLGAPDDHSGLSRVPMMDEASARKRCTEAGGSLTAKTWSLAEYRQLIESAGLSLVETYGCFPDYKLIRHLVPLQEVNNALASGLSSDEHSGCDGTKLSFSDDLPEVYRRLARNGVAQYFCPSYGFVARKPQ